MNFTSIIRFLVAGSLIVASHSCNSDVVEPSEDCDTTMATYSTNVKEIIDLSCAYSGCHDGNSAGPGNYSTFDGLASVIQSGSFVNRVIDQRSNPSIGMPPNMEIYPASQQDDLSPEQLEIIQCWIDSGFQE